MSSPSPLARAIAEHLDAHGGRDGPNRTEIDALALFRASRPSVPLPALYEASLCLVARGAKQVLVGDRAFDYDEHQYLLLTLGLPLAGRVVRAEPEAPYLGLALRVDVPILRDVVEAIGGPAAPPGDGPAGPGVFVGDLAPAPVDCATRLVRLLDTPAAIPIVYPAIARELYYWLLSGPHGPALASLARPDGHTARIDRAIRAIRSDLPRPIPSARLAEIAGMSPSSFHQHFRAMTALSPLQYQKRLRLLEARRLLMGRVATAADTARRVGYESPSQFSREYARMFGSPPRRDAAGSR